MNQPHCIKIMFFRDGDRLVKRFKDILEEPKQVIVSFHSCSAPFLPPDGSVAINLFYTGYHETTHTYLRYMTQYTHSLP